VGEDAVIRTVFGFPALPGR